MAAPRSQSLAARRARKLFYGVNVLTAVVLSFVLWYMVNYLTSRHYARWDLSSQGYFSLSERSLEVLDQLNEPLEIVGFISPQHALYTDVRHLLNEYEAASKDVALRWIDPERDLEQAESLLSRHRLARSQSVLFIAGSTMRAVSIDELKEEDEVQEGRYQPTRRIRFSGEQWFSSAIHSLSKKKRGTVYFLEGHGEKSARRTDSTGYSKIARLLEREYLEVKAFSFGDELSIPEDCDLLIIPGASRKVSQPELDQVSAYLERSGHVLLLLDALVDTGLEEMLGQWGVEVGHDLVIDRSRSFSGTEIYVRTYGAHPITAPLQGINTAFYNPRSVRPQQPKGPNGNAAAQDRPHVVALAGCSSNGWAEVDTDVSPARFDEGRDQPGPVSFSVAIERGVTLEDVEVLVAPTRMVVVGDSDFLSNGLLSGGAEEFALHSVNWLLGRDELLAIPPKTVDEVRLMMGKDAMDRLFLWAVVIMPGGAALLGLLAYWRRRA